MWGRGSYMQKAGILKGKIAFDKMSYKLFITICISALVGVFMVFMVVNTFILMHSNNHEMAEKEATMTTRHMVANIEEKLENLRQYYLYSADNDDVIWFMGNRLEYSDYSRYKSINAALGNNSLYPNYINNYVIVNIDDNRVISSRGIYDFSNMINDQEILDLYEANTKETNRGNWIYVADGTDVENTNTRYHLTVDTSGLNFVLNLPVGSCSTKGFLLVNINKNEWKQWIWDNISVSGKSVAVLDTEGNVIYSTSSSFSDKCIEKLSSKEPFKASDMDIDGYDQIVTGCTSTTLGWTYYVAYDYRSFLGFASKLMIEFMIAITALSVLSFVSLRHALYKPVDKLIKEVTDTDECSVSGNELTFLAGQFANLKNDKEVLSQTIINRRERLAELFEMRLIRSAVSANDEWEEYVKVLGLTERKFYACVSIILSQNENIDKEEEINEDAISLTLAEKLPENLKKKTWLPLIYDSCSLVCIMADDTEESLMEQISAYNKEFKEFAFNTYGYHIQMGVSELHTMYRHLGRAYHESVYALTLETDDAREHSQTLEKEADLCFYIQSSKADKADINLQKYEKEICDALKAMDKAQCYRLLDDFTDQLRNVGEWAVASVYYSTLIDTILTEVINMKIDILLVCPEGLHKLYQQIMDVGDVKKVRKNMKKMLVDPIIKERSNLLVDHSYQMMASIEQKLAESKGNITLNECADQLNVTPTYIWKILKAERGKTFSEYQEEYKIEEAKKLLQSNMSVSDVASELGYTNAQNFIRFFSKGTGLTPGKYRKLTYGYM